MPTQKPIAEVLEDIRKKDPHIYSSLNNIILTQAGLLNINVSKKITVKSIFNSLFKPSEIIWN